MPHDIATNIGASGDKRSSHTVPAIIVILINMNS